MKTTSPQFFVIAFLTVLSLAVGCSDGSKVSKDTTTFDKAFESAAADTKTAASKTSAAFKAGKMEEAGNALAETAKKQGLTQEQKDGILDMVTKIQTVMAQDPSKSDIKIWQAMENTTAALEGRSPKIVGLPDSVDGANQSGNR